MTTLFSSLRAVALTVAAALTFASLAATASAQTVRVGTEGAYPPWNFFNDDGDLAGYEIDLANLLCERMNRECEFIANQWDSIIPNLVAGNYDLIMAGMTITDERRETIDFSQDYYPPDPLRYVASEGESFDFDNLVGAKIGVQVATTQSGYADAELSPANTILAYETFDQSVADLAAGNVDLLFADASVLAPVVDGSGGAVVFVGPDVLLGYGTGAGIRKADDALEAAFNAALAEIKADGSLDALIDDWFEGKGPFYDN